MVRIMYLEETEKRSCEVSRLLSENDFMCADLMFVELDDDVGILLIVVESSRKAIDRCHDVFTR